MAQPILDFEIFEQRKNLATVPLSSQAKARKRFLSEVVSGRKYSFPSLCALVGQPAWGRRGTNLLWSQTNCDMTMNGIYYQTNVVAEVEEGAFLA